MHHFMKSLQGNHSIWLIQGIIKLFIIYIKDLGWQELLHRCFIIREISLSTHIWDFSRKKQIHSAGDGTPFRKYGMFLTWASYSIMVIGIAASHFSYTMLFIGYICSLYTKSGYIGIRLMRIKQLEEAITTLEFIFCFS